MLGSIAVGSLKMGMDYRTWFETIDLVIKDKFVGVNHEP
jgi:hypothetical protein